MKNAMNIAILKSGALVSSSWWVKCDSYLAGNEGDMTGPRSKEGSDSGCNIVDRLNGGNRKGDEIIWWSSLIYLYYS